MAGQKRTDSKGRVLKDGESQLKNGMYRYRYRDADGTYRDVYSSRLVSTDKAAPGKKTDISLREKEKQIRRDIEDGIKAVVENDKALNDMFAIYMSTKPNLKESTRNNYVYMYKNYVQDVIGNKKINSIKYSDIKAFYNSLIFEKKFKPNSMEIIHTILHPVFELSVRDGYIRTNPTNGAMSEIKKSMNWEKPKRHALTIEEQQAFLGFLSKSPEYNHWLTIFTVFLGTGCRAGELIGLRWRDCDFTSGTISINHNLIYRQMADGRCEYRITTPKTESGTRVIPMIKAVREALLKEYNEQLQTGFNQDVIDDYSGFIFCNRFKKVHNPSTLNVAIKRIYTKHNEQEKARAKQEDRAPLLIRHFSLHNLRHTFCTRLCENESNLKVIQDIMGHSDIETTMNIYAEVSERMKKKSLANIEDKIILLEGSQIDFNVGNSLAI